MCSLAERVRTVRNLLDHDCSSLVALDDIILSKSCFCVGIMTDQMVIFLCVLLKVPASQLFLPCSLARYLVLCHPVTRGLCMLLDLLSVTFLMLRECCSVGTLGEFQHTWHWQLLVSNCPAWPCVSNAACDFYGSEV